MYKLLAVFLLSISITLPAHAAKKCKVSMMGRVCYEEGQEVATSEHMKTDAVAEAKAKQKTKVAIKK